MGFDFGSVVGKVVEWTAPAPVRAIADAVGVDLEDVGDKAGDAYFSVAKKVAESPLHPYGQAKMAYEAIRDNPEAAESAARMAGEGAAWAVAPWFMGPKKLIEAVRDNPDKAKEIAKVAGGPTTAAAIDTAEEIAADPEAALEDAETAAVALGGPGTAVAIEGAKRFAEDPQRGLELLDKVSRYLPGGAITSDIRKAFLGF